LLKYYLAIAVRVLNILLNVGTSVVLAHSLSVTDRGYAAAIISVTGSSVMLCTAVYCENILKFDKENTKTLCINLNFARIFSFCLISWIVIQNLIGEMSSSILVMAIMIIVLGISNTILNALAHRKSSLIANQIFLFVLTLVYFTLLYLHSLLFQSTLFFWILALFIANVFTLVCFLLYFTRKKIKIEICVTPLFIKKSLSRRFKAESVAVYSSNVSLQILIIILSQLISPIDLANAAVLLSLFSIVGIPLVPLLPNLIASPNDYIKFLLNYKVWNLLRNLIWISSYCIIVSFLIEMVFPFVFGVKYLDIRETVPFVVLAAVCFSGGQYLSALSRGLGIFWLSTSLNLIPVFMSISCILIQPFTLNVLFVCISMSYALMTLVGYKILRGRHLGLSDKIQQ